MTLWVDVVARARGLRTHRLAPGTLAALRRSADLPELARSLAHAGFPLAEGERSAEALDLAVRRRAAAELRILARWCGERTTLLAVIFEDEDRRSLRAILRGALQHQAPDARTRGLVPTPALPERALAELARAATPGAAVTLLSVWNHPFAAALRAAAGAAVPDPLALDVALDRAWAARAAAGAGRDGPELGHFVRDAVDLTNAATLLSLAGAPPGRGADLFLEGGRRLPHAEFIALLARTRPAAAQALATRFAGTPYAPVLQRTPLRALDDALLRARLDAQRRAALRAPLGAAPVLWYALELRVETIELSRTIWGLALGAPLSARAP